MSGCRRSSRMPDSLTVKQQRFVEEYLLCLEGKKAAIAAGYSEKTADKQAYQLLEHPRVKAAITKAMERRSKRIQASQDYVVQELMKLAGANIKDFLAFRTEKQQVGIDPETLQPVLDYQQVIEMQNSDDVDGTLISEVSLDAKGGFKFKLHDRTKALELLGKHLGMFQDRLKVGGDDESGPVHVVFAIPRPKGSEE